MKNTQFYKFPTAPHRSLHKANVFMQIIKRVIRERKTQLNGLSPKFWLVILKFLWYQLLIPKFMVRALWFIHEKQICSPLGLQSTGYMKTLFWYFKYAHKTDQGNDRKAQVWNQCILPQTRTSSAPEITKSCIPARSVQRQNPCPAENPACSQGVLPKLTSPSPRR